MIDQPASQNYVNPPTADRQHCELTADNPLAEPPAEYEDDQPVPETHLQLCDRDYKFRRISALIDQLATER